MAAGQSGVREVWTDEAGPPSIRMRMGFCAKANGSGSRPAASAAAPTCKTCRRVLMGWSVASAVGRG